MQFQQFSLRSYQMTTAVKLRGMIDGRERSRLLIINKNENRPDRMRARSTPLFIQRFYPFSLFILFFSFQI